MASSPKGLRLLKALDLVKNRPTFDATTVLKKVNLQSVSNGVMKGSFTIEPAMCNIGGTIHGGYIASVVDVFSFYSQLSNPDGRVSWTTTMNIFYVGTAREGQTVSVETKPVRTGDSSIVETYFHNSNGKLIAKATATFVAGLEKHQKLLKDQLNMDVYEN